MKGKNKVWKGRSKQDLILSDGTEGHFRGTFYFLLGPNFDLLVVSLHLSEGPLISKENTPTQDLISVTLGSTPKGLQG